MCGLCAVVTIYTTFVVFTRKHSIERPTFVTLQMVFLNVFWVCFVVYIVLLSQTFKNNR